MTTQGKIKHIINRYDGDIVYIIERFEILDKIYRLAKNRIEHDKKCSLFIDEACNCAYKNIQKLMVELDD